MTLNQLLPENSVRGTGLLTRLDERYVFLVSGRKHKTPVRERFYFGIGGHLENDETFEDAVKREAYEEVGTKINLLNNELTYYININNEIKKVELQEKVNPFLIYEMGAKCINTIYYVVIYTGNLLAKPTVNDIEECSAIIGLTLRQMKSYGDKKIPLGKMLSEGGTLFDGAIDNSTRLFPIGTPKAFGMLLKEEVMEGL